MTSAYNIIARIEELGGALALHGERIRCRLPEHATYMLEELRSQRDEVIRVLSQRMVMPAMPAIVRLVSWHLKQPPVVIDTCSVITDCLVFARSTLEQLRVALADPKRWVGWSVPQLLERLAQVGVIVKLEDDA